MTHQLNLSAPECREFSVRVFQIWTSRQCFLTLFHSAGKNGMEVQRVSGTNGRVNDQSTRDILSLLAKDDKLLPNKAGACLILPGEKYY